MLVAFNPVSSFSLYCRVFRICSRCYSSTHAKSFRCAVYGQQPAGSFLFKVDINEIRYGGADWIPSGPGLVLLRSVELVLFWTADLSSTHSLTEFIQCKWRSWVLMVLLRTCPVPAKVFGEFYISYFSTHTKFLRIIIVTNYFCCKECCDLYCISPLNTKRRPLYLKTQFVPHSKHFSSRL